MTTADPGASVVFTHGLLVSPRSTALLASSAAPIITCGFEVLVQDVIAAITTWPWSISVSVPSSIVTGGGVGGQCLAERLLGLGDRDPVLGALGAGDRGDDGGEVELEVLGERR